MNREPLNLLSIVILLLIIAVGAAIFVPVYRSSRPVAAKSICLSNIKQLSTSAMIYLADHNERFPQTTWDHAFQPYYRDRAILTCSVIAKAEKKWGYAMNFEAVGKPTTEMKYPSTVVMLFETDALAPGIVANLAARALTRHDNGSHVSFVDSHVKWVGAAEKP